MNLGSPITETFGCNCQYHYQDSDFIARGAFGIVYKVKIKMFGNCTGDEVAAVKVVHLQRGVEVLRSPGSWDALRQRWRNLLELKHSHLVAYRQVAITTSLGGASVRFLMDYCDGHDLSTILRQATANRSLMDQSTVICYSIQIADGLQYLHQHGIIHGDLKPENVLVKRSQCGHHTLLIGDLDDLVQMHRSVSSTRDFSMLRGTVRYMSPEMLQKFVRMAEVVIGRKTDMWSLGCIILQLACCHGGIEARCLHNPATGDRFAVQSYTSDFHFCAKIIDGFVPFVDDMLPEFLATSIRSCLQFDTEDRMSPEGLLDKFRAKAEVLEQNEAERRQRCVCGKQQVGETVRGAKSTAGSTNAWFYLGMLVLAGLGFFVMLMLAASGAGVCLPHANPSLTFSRGVANCSENGKYLRHSFPQKQ